MFFIWFFSGRGEKEEGEALLSFRQEAIKSLSFFLTAIAGRTGKTCDCAAMECCECEGEEVWKSLVLSVFRSNFSGQLKSLFFPFYAFPISHPLTHVDPRRCVDECQEDREAI